jgi:KRAB domain-containing zinc finger protein
MSILNSELILFHSFQCGKITNTKGNLQQHINKMHLQLRPYTCSLCPKKFKSTLQVEVHMRSHTGTLLNEWPKVLVILMEMLISGEKPFVCQYCPKTFGHQSDWKRHEMVHTGNYPYSCRACDKKFIRKSHWIAHEEQHGFN